MSRPHLPELDGLRAKIDDIDQRLVKLLNDRAEVIRDVGRVKRAAGVPLYAPHREAEVLKRVLAMSEGPLSDRAIEAVYRELISGSIAVEEPLSVAFLGPEGSFSHTAARAHFGSSVSFTAVWSMEAVLNEVRRKDVDYGLVPIENSIGGGVNETLDALFAARSEVGIYAEALLGIRHHLFGNGARDAVKVIYSRPEVFAQCRRWLAGQYPHTRLVPESSTSQALIRARDEARENPEAGAAAIGSALAGEIYGVKVLYEGIEDNPNNITRFFVVGREAAKRTGDDKTSIMFTTRDEPGALARVLMDFERAGVNLTHIDKRPSGRENWTYTFFVDAAAHREDSELVEALQRIDGHCQDLVVLGSYPRALQIL